jgi:pimeloyl-ACP methyl ester carboxylesterase
LPAEIVDRGSGTPVVLIPGIQGRWEYSRGTVEALARFCRVITFSLCDEGIATSREDARARGPMDVFAEQVASTLDRLRLDRAAIVGVSFGGLVALRFAAERPSRTSALVLVSPPGPAWRLSPRHETYARLPWIFGPLFVAGTPFRLWHEIVTALPDRGTRAAFTRQALATVLRSPVSLARTAARARRIGEYDRAADARRVNAPTLVLQGEAALDRVTGEGGTGDYLSLIPGARAFTLERTGHLGSVTRAEECARGIGAFLDTVAKGTHHSAA